MTSKYDVTKDALDVLKCIEWAHDSSGYEFCPLCFGLEPNHRLNCKLDETIKNLEAIFALPEE